MIRGDFKDYTKKQINCAKGSKSEYTDLEKSLHFRVKCMDAGFTLTGLYPCYHQGWEMDYWGAMGVKDGKRYRLETNHGALQVTEVGLPLPDVKLIKTL